MVSFIDFAFVEGLRPIFVFLIIFAVIYALLTNGNYLGTNKTLHAIIAFVIGIFMALSSKLTQVIMVMIPWFVIIIFFIVLTIVVFKVSGINGEQPDMAELKPALMWVLLIVFLVILVGSISYVYGQDELEITKGDINFEDSNITHTTGSPSKLAVGYPDSLDSDTTDYAHNAKATIYHPRMLGLIFILIIGMLTVMQLTRF